MKSISTKDLLSRQLDLVKSRTSSFKSGVSKKQRDKLQTRNGNLPGRRAIRKKKDFNVKAPSRAVKSELSRNLRSIVASVKKVKKSSRANSPEKGEDNSLPEPETEQKAGVADAEIRDLQERILQKLTKR
mmetsp:Transcript_2953/g.5127  ORF Transcript_2953/g.5127 Transcript_2953/m.5127 type:complete len:130 (+) Transcript_2953:20-409(+)